MLGGFEQDNDFKDAGMTNENRRKIRRGMPRRTYDALRGVTSEAGRKNLDELLWSRFFKEDRRVRDRRVEEDRRSCAG